MTMIKPYFIGIAGESGVGKSTIAEIVSLFFDSSSTILSTDDLHKWERTNSAWENITHLNPDANNLDLGDFHLFDLSQGKSIFRSIYNHKTGNFNPPQKIKPSKIIIIEGLHAFYTDLSQELINLKIFIDTDEDLKTHWKIIRDTEERGYKYNQVLDIINKRKFDSDKIKNSQINVADAVIHISSKEKISSLGDKNEKINLDISISVKNPARNQDLFNFIQKYISEFNIFSTLSDTLGNDINFCQDGGGNISIKISPEHLIIKSSGFSIKNAYKSKGYSIINYRNFHSSIDDSSLDQILTTSPISPKYKKPSMESGVHASLPYKYVIHLHPIYSTLILCLENSRSIINSLFSNFDYLTYVNPGYELFQAIQNKNKSLIFLENHGLIISSNQIDDALNLLFQTEEISKAYLKRFSNFQEFDLSFAEFPPEKQYPFPDAAIFSDKKETLAAQNYISILGNKIDKVRYLPTSDVNKLKNMEAEKYRRAQ